MCDRTRCYVWTLNNYTEDEIALINSGDYSYLVYGKEVGESGTPHLQGFVRFENDKTMSAIHKLKGWKRTALKKSEKPLSAIDYCKKGTQSHTEWESMGVRGPTYGMDADVFELGAYHQGSRSDLNAVYDKVKSGTSVDDICWENPDAFMKCHKALERLEDIRLLKTYRTEMTEGIWIYGKTGTGKSDMAFDNFDCSKSYVYPYDNGWCDGYRQNEVVIIDEFRGQITFSEILRFADKHPNLQLRRRNKPPMPFTSKRVIVTSSLPPCMVYCNLSKEDSLEQLYRRYKIFELIDNKLVLRDKEFFENGLHYASS